MFFYTRGENLQRPITAVSLIRGVAFTVPRLPGQTKPQLFCYSFPAHRVSRCCKVCWLPCERPTI